MKWLINFWNWLFYSKCPNCPDGNLHFDRTDTSLLGSPDVYICNKCKKEFV